MQAQHIRQPLALGYKYYKHIDFGEPNGEIKHNIHVRVGPKPVPYYRKSSNRKVFNTISDKITFAPRPTKWQPRFS